MLSDKLVDFKDEGIQNVCACLSFFLFIHLWISAVNVTMLRTSLTGKERLALHTSSSAGKCEYITLILPHFGIQPLADYKFCILVLTG